MGVLAVSSLTIRLYPSSALTVTSHFVLDKKKKVSVGKDCTFGFLVLGLYKRSLGPWCLLKNDTFTTWALSL